jgi:hypothetical protein
MYSLHLIIDSTKSVPKPGIVVENEPFQRILPSATALNLKGYTMNPVAEYRVKARVLLTDTYYWSPGADISPIDLTLGWKEMSDSANFSKIPLGHGYRNYSFWVSDVRTLPLPIPTILLRSANMHLIPASTTIKRKLFEVKPNDIVLLEGKLVNLTKADGWSWNTSLTRTDTGDGACEIMYVENIE